MSTDRRPLFRGPRAEPRPSHRAPLYRVAGERGIAVAVVMPGNQFPNNTALWLVDDRAGLGPDAFGYSLNGAINKAIEVSILTGEPEDASVYAAAARIASLRGRVLIIETSVAMRET